MAAAKLNKTATRELAKKHAQAMAAPAYDVIEPLTHDARQQRARIEADLQATQQGVATDLRDTYVEAYAEAALNIYYGVIKARERARARWRQALSGLPLEKATERARALLRSFNVRGGTVSEGSVDLTVRRAWALEASLYVRFERQEELVENPDNNRQRAGRYSVRVELNWGSTSRSVSHALASATLYRELAELGAELEVAMADEQIYWTWGVDAPAEDAAATAEAVRL